MVILGKGKTDNFQLLNNVTFERERFLGEDDNL